MKRKNLSPNSCSSSSTSSSSSSSCIQSCPKLNINHHQGKKPKRVGTKKILKLPQNSPTSSKSRSSIYRGVTRHRWTGRFEAHLWDKTTWNSIQNKKGRQIYLGAYDNEEDAARTYDLAALKYWGTATTLNFPLETYTKAIEDMLTLSKEECLVSLRRQSSGFSRGISKYRGVARHHHNGRWEARIGNVSGNKYLYLGTYSTQEEAAMAYDMAAIEFRGPNAVTNFDINNYTNKLKRILPENEEVKVKQEVPNSSNDASHDCERDKNQVVVQPRISKLELIDSVDLQAMSIMDNVEDHENGHPWDLFLDTGINSLPILDIPIHKASELQGLLFDDKGFEENIEYIFDGSFDDYKFRRDEISTSSGANAEVLVVREGKVKDLSTSPSNSNWSLSTTTSVCSNT